MAQEGALWPNNTWVMSAPVFWANIANGSSTIAIRCWQLENVY